LKRLLGGTVAHDRQGRDEIPCVAVDTVSDLHLVALFEQHAEQKLCLTAIVDRFTPLQSEEGSFDGAENVFFFVLLDSLDRTRGDRFLVRCRVVTTCSKHECPAHNSYRTFDAHSASFRSRITV